MSQRSNQHFKFRTRKIFKFDSDYTAYGQEAIVHFLKVGYEQKTIDGKKWGHIVTYISKYRYAITIDLLFFLVRLEWIGREKNAPTKVQEKR